jgi:regulator of sirC expression with transglutaminase-like and TPR domain
MSSDNRSRHSREIRMTLSQLLTGFDGGPPLDLCLALIAADEDPTLDPHELVGRLDQLSDGLSLAPDGPVVERLARLQHHLFETLGFSGDEETYDDPVNSRLDQVLHRRKGLPIMLSALVIEVGRRVGLPIDGVGFPGHFMVAPTQADPRFFFDPFNNQVVRAEGLHQKLEKMLGHAPTTEEWERFTGPVTPRLILVRVNNNLKHSHMRRWENDAALRAVRRNLAIAPDLVEEQRDLGLVLARLGRLDEAVDALEQYVACEPFAHDTHEILGVLEALQHRGSGEDG